VVGPRRSRSGYPEIDSDILSTGFLAWSVEPCRLGSTIWREEVVPSRPHLINRNWTRPTGLSPSDPLAFCTPQEVSLEELIIASQYLWKVRTADPYEVQSSGLGRLCVAVITIGLAVLALDLAARGAPTLDSAREMAIATEPAR